MGTQKLFDENSIEELQKLSTEELENYELNRIQYNANKVCDEVVSRIDDASGPGGYLIGYKAEKKEDMFLQIKSFLLTSFQRETRKEAKFLVLFTIRSCQAL